MKILKSLFFSTLLIITLFSTTAQAGSFEIHNNCPYTVWAAAIPGGGRKLNTGQAWAFVPTNSTPGRIWARTNCTFNSNGTGSCETGDCGGVLQCTANGSPPNTLVEFALNQFTNLDFLDISLLDGFNVPVELSRPSSGCTGGISCNADINSECPEELKVPGGCHNPCRVIQANQFCCNSGGTCKPTLYSKFFKDKCPSAYSYPTDGPSSTFTCPGGSNYTVVFCP